jgi:hypothetical protein
MAVYVKDGYKAMAFQGLYIRHRDWAMVLEPITDVFRLDFAYKIVDERGDNTFLLLNPYNMRTYIGYDIANDTLRLYPEGHSNIMRWRFAHNVPDPLHNRSLSDTIQEALQKVTPDVLNALDMTPVTSRLAFKGFIEHSAGQQPYRFMKFLLSTLTINKQNVKASIIGVGRDGHLATLSAFPDVSVDVYDAYLEHKQFDDEPRSLLWRPNVSMKGRANMDAIVASDLILFDLHPHDGGTETTFLAELSERNYCGIVVLTCIGLNDMMRKMWEKIAYEKLDVSSKAHWAGTGVVFFESAAACRKKEIRDIYQERAAQADARLKIQSHKLDIGSHMLEDICLACCG